MRKNLILCTDSYKLSHAWQYPEGTQFVSSYIEARKGEESVFFGLQAILKEFFTTPITAEDIDEAETVCMAHIGMFNREGWETILKDHGGYIPLEVKAVPEGTVMPTRNAQVVIVNTDPRLPWLTSYFEPVFLQVWYPSTVATLSRNMKKIIYEGLKVSSDDPDAQIPFKLHDFGYRGTSSFESACFGGMGHLVNFMGTDTIPALTGVKRFYEESLMAGFSIPASEHSTITAWGKDGEIDAYRNMLKKFPTGLMACVSDSYDIFNATANYWGNVLHDEVMQRDGTLVVRPDSGNPTTVPLDIIEILMDKFGFSVNSKGFKVLPPQVRIIQGDGITAESLPILIMNAVERNISIDNFAMGMGGGLLQKVDRDTFGYAMKTSAAYINGNWRDVYKDPITDQGKASKRGIQKLVKVDGQFKTVAEIHAQGLEDQMKLVYKDGKLFNTQTFTEIRERAKL